MRMDKSTQKRNKCNALVVEQLSKKFGVTPRFVRQSISGERNSLTSETITREYKALVKKVESAFK